MAQGTQLIMGGVVFMVSLFISQQDNLKAWPRSAAMLRPWNDTHQAMCLPSGTLPHSSWTVPPTGAQGLNAYGAFPTQRVTTSYFWGLKNKDGKETCWVLSTNVVGNRKHLELRSIEVHLQILPDSRKWELGLEVQPASQLLHSTYLAIVFN